VFSSGAESSIDDANAGSVCEANHEAVETCGERVRCLDSDLVMVPITIGKHKVLVNVRLCMIIFNGAMLILNTLRI